MFAVAFANVARIVPSDKGIFVAELLVDFTGFGDEFRFVFEEWRNAEFVGGEVFGEFEDDTLAVVDGFFGVGSSKDGEEKSFDANGWLDDVRDKGSTGLFVAVFHGFAGFFGDVGKVKIGAVGQAHEFFFAVGVIKHKINSAFAVMGAVFGGNFEFVDVVGVQANDVFKKIVLSRAHGLEVFCPGVGCDEIFDFHLATFAVTEDEITRADFVAESFALLGDAEWHRRINRVNDVFVVGKNALGGFGTEVGDVLIG